MGPQYIECLGPPTVVIRPCHSPYTSCLIAISSTDTKPTHFLVLLPSSYTSIRDTRTLWFYCRHCSTPIRDIRTCWFDSPHGDAVTQDSAGVALDVNVFGQHGRRETVHQLSGGHGAGVLKIWRNTPTVHLRF